MSNIPRHQRILFWVMLGGSILMALYLIRLRERTHDRLTALNDPTPLAAPAEMPAGSVTLELANDNDGSITPVRQSIALPQEPTIRARALLDHLLAQYSLPQSTHPLAAGGAIDEVFLLPIAGSRHADSSPASSRPANSKLANSKAGSSGPGTLVTDNNLAAESNQDALASDRHLMAVINLHSSFVESHPSGVAVETLTVLSIARTLHDNMPAIEQVRFLVDGQERDTLAGHADLTRVYLTGDTEPAATSSTAAGTR